MEKMLKKNDLIDFLVYDNFGRIVLYTPVFNSNTSHYFAMVSEEVTGIMLLPFAEEQREELIINDISVRSGTLTTLMPLSQEVNTFPIVVTSVAQEMKTYRITITKN